MSLNVLIGGQTFLGRREMVEQVLPRFRACRGSVRNREIPTGRYYSWYSGSRTLLCCVDSLMCGYLSPEVTDRERVDSLFSQTRDRSQELS